MLLNNPFPYTALGFALGRECGQSTNVQGKNLLVSSVFLIMERRVVPLKFVYSSYRQSDDKSHISRSGNLFVSHISLEIFVKSHSAF